MNSFILIATAIALLAFALILRPLWRQSWLLAAAITLTLVITGGGIYRLIGTPKALDPAARQQPDAPRDLDSAIALLRDALRTHPDQVEGWLLLGSSLSSQQKFGEARDAYAKAVELQPNEPEVLVIAAQSRMLADADHHLDATAVQLLVRALGLQPAHQRARWFLGQSQRQAGDPAAAAETWRPLLNMVDTATRSSLLEQINSARREAGQEELDATAASDHRFKVSVSLDPELMAKQPLPGDSQVFVIARIPGDTAMPIAVEKHRLDELPLIVTLDDSDGPMPTQRLSGVDEIEVLARLSLSGSADRHDSDLETPTVRVSLPTADVVELVLKPQPVQR